MPAQCSRPRPAARFSSATSGNARELAEEVIGTMGVRAIHHLGGAALQHQADTIRRDAAKAPGIISIPARYCSIPRALPGRCEAKDDDLASQRKTIADRCSRRHAPLVGTSRHQASNAPAVAGPHVPPIAKLASGTKRNGLGRRNAARYLPAFARSRNQRPLDLRTAAPLRRRPAGRQGLAARRQPHAAAVDERADSGGGKNMTGSCSALPGGLIVSQSASAARAAVR